MTVRRDPSKLLQIGFVGLLVISVAQASYWMYDHVTHTRAVRDELRVLYEAEADTVSAFFSGAGVDTIAQLLPHIEIDANARTAQIRASALAEVDREAATRINQFLWEGAFFLAVLLGGLTIMTRTIRHDAELRRRQQNFLAAVSHEFKSPLASIRLAAETLLLRADKEETRRLGQRIIDDDERLLRMVENLLDTTRLEEGRHTLTESNTSLAETADVVIKAVADRAAQSDIEISAEIGPELVVWADRQALQTILGNLLDNAINACVAGGGKHIELTAGKSVGGITLTVRDDGAGFPPEDAKMIFEKFYRAGDEIRRSTPGSGLGLYIVKRLAALSGARVEAESKGSGRGAAFTLTWRERGQA